MALTLGVNTKSKIYVGDVMLSVLRTNGFQSITIKVASNPPVEHLITDLDTKEILPEVFVSCGQPSYKYDGNLPRLVFEAPKKIVILREELYLRNHAQ